MSDQLGPDFDERLGAELDRVSPPTPLPANARFHASPSAYRPLTGRKLALASAGAAGGMKAGGEAPGPHPKSENRQTRPTSHRDGPRRRPSTTSRRALKEGILDPSRPRRRRPRPPRARNIRVPTSPVRSVIRVTQVGAPSQGGSHAQE